MKETCMKSKKIRLRRALSETITIILCLEKIIWIQVFKMVDPGFYFDGPRFFLEILVDPGLVDPGSEKLSFTLLI